MDKHRHELEQQYRSFAEFRKNYQIPDDIIESIFAEAEKKNIKAANEKDRKDSEARIRMIMKALIARDIWDMSEYFAIVYENDEMVRKAVDILSGK
jgi:carboxyl-terminal processing protease